MKNGNFLKKGGLIYATTICLCAIALLIASARIQITGKKEMTELPTAAPQTEKREEAVSALVTPKPTEEPSECPSAEPSPVPLEKMALILPVTGTVQKEWSGDKLVKSATMRDFRVHSGADITAAIGADVVAAADGVIADIYFDNCLGISILVDHENGAQTLYQNLSTDTMVAKGDRVKRGTVISHVGDTASSEYRDASHLHWALLVNEENKNPMEYVRE